MANYEVYKKWRTGGFASFVYWTDGGKVIVDIGDFNKDTGKQISNTKCYIDVESLLAYLHSEVHNVVQQRYPSMSEGGNKHGLVWFGGVNTAKVFKIEDWNADGKDSFSVSDKRRFKCGEFEKVEGADGSRPNFAKKISVNSIQMKSDEIGALYQSLLAHYHAHIASAMTNSSPLDSLVEYKSNE